MDRRLLRRLPAALLAALALPAAAQEMPSWYARIDNDVAFGTDRWYTSGVRLGHVQRRGSYWLEWGLQHEVYTPEAKHFALGDIDRGPAARLLAAIARHDVGAAHFQTVELAVGVRGPAALGEQSTDLIHRVIAAPEVDWSRQGNDRLDAGVAFARTQEFPALAFHYGAVAGTQLAFVHAGAELRIGPAARRVHTPLLRFAATPAVVEKGATGWSAFVGASARAVARNRLLAPGYDPFVADPSRERLVARGVVGIAWSQPWATLSFTLAGDTREFESQRRSHGFGSLAAHVDF